jgi:hypothetical protein
LVKIVGEKIDDGPKITHARPLNRAEIHWCAAVHWRLRQVMGDAHYLPYGHFQ